VVQERTRRHTLCAVAVRVPEGRARLLVHGDRPAHGDRRRIGCTSKGAWHTSATQPPGMFQLFGERVVAWLRSSLGKIWERFLRETRRDPPLRPQHTALMDKKVSARMMQAKAHEGDMKAIKEELAVRETACMLLLTPCMREASVPTPGMPTAPPVTPQAQSERMIDCDAKIATTASECQGQVDAATVQRRRARSPA
jgi:hypothetical protein